VPAAMKWRRSSLADMILSRIVADGTASGRLCHGWQARQIGAFQGLRLVRQLSISAE
jgi:hypothetical protein